MGRESGAGSGGPTIIDADFEVVSSGAGGGRQEPPMTTLNFDDEDPASAPGGAGGDGRARRPRGRRRRRLMLGLAALAMPSLLLAAGLAVDLFNANEVQARLRAAAQTAAWVAADEASRSPELGPAALEAAAARALRNLLDPAELAYSRIDVDPGRKEVEVVLIEAAENRFVSVIGYDSMRVAGRGVAPLDGANLEIALVLDTTRSIDAEELRAVKDAALALVDAVTEGLPPATPRVRVSVVPFQGLVTVGRRFQSAPWVDGEGRAPHHFNHLGPSGFAAQGGARAIETADAPGLMGGAGAVSRFELFDRFANVAWAGCFEARAEPYDLLDTPADPTNPATLYVPYFAPDEPHGLANNYLPDSGGACAAGPEAGGYGAVRGAIAHSCKYGAPGERALRATAAEDPSRPLGPNYYCTATEMLPLTEDMDAVRDKIEAIQVSGHPATDLVEGLSWGWRAVSPQAPFTEGRPYEDGASVKIVVLMTDGDNWMRRGLGGNYMATGYPGDGRLDAAAGAPITDDSATGRIQAAMNARTLALCQNIRRAGVRIYTVGFGVPRRPDSVLSLCAGDATRVFYPSEGDDLIADFRAIGDQMRALQAVAN